MDAPSVSSIMFHTVGPVHPDWAWRHLTVSPEFFSDFLRWLRRFGYRTVLLDEYQDLCLRGKLAKERAIALTFDDGYLDNWVYASVILEQYGYCGTVFVSGDFIDPGEEVRPRWNGHPDHRPDTNGFLNRAELRALDQSKVLDVQSHCMTHTWYPESSRIVDFRFPGDQSHGKHYTAPGYHWMNWNLQPEQKWRWVQPPEDPTLWGEPVYAHRKSLNGPRYYPNPELGAALRAEVRKKGDDFFQRSDWRETLFDLASRLEKELPDGTQETEEEFTARVEYELSEPLCLLGNLLNKEVSYLCWPGGGYGEAVFDLAARYYKGTTISSSFDSIHRQGMDQAGCFRFSRFGPLTAGNYTNIRYIRPMITALYTEERRGHQTLCRLLRGGMTKLARLGML